MTGASQPTEALPAGILLRYPEASQRAYAAVVRTLPANLRPNLASMLLASPSPDSAIRQLERVLDTVIKANTLPSFYDSHVLQYMLIVLGHSEWLGATIVHNPGLLPGLVRSRALGRSYGREQFEVRLRQFLSVSSATDPSEALAVFRREEYVRILLRDVLGLATMAETTEEISALSDVLIGYALHYVFGRQGQNVTDEHFRFAVLGLGKLGGCELNYSSDIDLLYLYDGDRDRNASLSSRHYAIRLAQQTTELLARHNKEGHVFRIDLRLRPQGSQEELAVALSHAVRYYRETAQDWELQALIKGRHIAGDAKLSSEFLKAVEPQVYRPQLNFSAIKTALQARERIDKRHRHHSVISPSHSVDVKLDRGGIRDIEFLVQCLQRVYGGPEPWLRSRGTLFALQKLHDKGHLTGRDFHSLTRAYIFLRNIEHRLQLKAGHQTHRLPSVTFELEELALSVSSGTDTWTGDALQREVELRMKAVAEIYRRVIFQEQTHEQAEQNTAGPLVRGQRQQLQRLILDVPSLASHINSGSLSTYGRNNLDRFITSATANAERYQTIKASPHALCRSLKLFELSDYCTELLVRHPADVVLLAEGSSPYETRPPQSPSELRESYRQSLLRVIARELFESESTQAAFRNFTGAADIAIRDAMALCSSCERLAIMALGRLGSCELDLLSDADLLFVAAEDADLHQLRAPAQRVIELLTTYTTEGAMFAVDTRLRPHGEQGELIVTPSQLELYFSQDAMPWEALAYLRLRFVAGDRDLGNAVIRAVQGQIAAIATRPAFTAELSAVRTRLENADASPNFKSGPGGSYDIDYLVGALQLRHRIWTPGTLPERISGSREHGVLAAEEADCLSKHAEFLRTLEHIIRIVTAKAAKWLPSGEHARRSVATLLNELLPDPEERTVEQRLLQALEKVRILYLRGMPK